MQRPAAHPAPACGRTVVSWAEVYQNDPAGQDGAVAMAVSPAGLVFVTGTSARANADRDYATIAYSG